MTITLPDEMRDRLEHDAKAGGFATVDEYVLHLVRSDESSVPGTAEELGFESEAALEAKLLASLDSGPTVEATPEFWTNLRKQVAERVARGERP